jgi:hypothetical protein
MNLSRCLFCAATLASLAGCSNGSDDPKPLPSALMGAPSGTPAATTADVQVDVPPAKPGIEARVKAEVDQRADGLGGTALAVAGSKASLATPIGWQTTKGDVTVSAPTDKKTQIAASSFATEGATGKLLAVLTALGLASCEWNPTETLTIGKTALAGTGADGVCTRGTTRVRTAYVAPQAEGLLVVGAWEPDGDSASVFGAMRSIVKPTATGGDATGIGTCCAALRGNAKSAPEDQKNLLLMAAGMCDAVKNDPNGRAALAQVRTLLKNANMPSSCR